MKVSAHVADRARSLRNDFATVSTICNALSSTCYYWLSIPWASGRFPYFAWLSDVLVLVRPTQAGWVSAARMWQV
jgi:hypothetical protein